MQPRKLIAGNWKMNKTSADGAALVHDILLSVGRQTDVEVLVCPPFTALESVSKALDGSLPTLARLRALDDDAIIERLTSIRGIGRWTVEMMLMFRLGRSDVLPATDLGIRKGFQLTFCPRAPALPAPRAILELGERWRPYRSLASWYLYRAVDLEKAARTKSKGK